MSLADVRRDMRNIELARVDDPALPARESMDDAKLEELVQSIRANGVLMPIFVKVVGDRYEVIAGHRRTLASRLAERTMIPAVIVEDIGAASETIKLHENTKREDLNVAEEAVYFAQLLDSLAGGDVDRLCDLVSENRQYVENRLALLRGDEEVLAALKVGAINFSVASELNKVTDVGARRNYLEAAITGGASGRLVREWRLAFERLVGARQEHADGDPTHVGGVEQPIGSLLCCLLCESSKDPHVMELVYLHRHCLQIFERTVGVQLRGVFGPRDAAPPATSTSGGQS